MFVLLIHNNYVTKAVIFPVIAINLVFVFTMIVNGRIYLKYDAGFQIAQLINSQEELPVIDYGANLLSLELHVKDKYTRISTIKMVPKSGESFYLVIDASNTDVIEAEFKNKQLRQIMHADGIPQEKFIPSLFNTDKRKNNMRHYAVYKIN